MIAFNNHHSGIEETVPERFVFRCRNQIVQRSERTVSIFTHLCIGMSPVVENLKLATYGRPFPFVQIGINKVLDSTVGPFGYFEVDL